MVKANITFVTADENTTYISAGVINNGKKFTKLVDFSALNKIKTDKQDFCL